MKPASCPEAQSESLFGGIVILLVPWSNLRYVHENDMGIELIGDSHHLFVFTFDRSPVLFMETVPLEYLLSTRLVFRCNAVTHIVLENKTAQM